MLRALACPNVLQFQCGFDASDQSEQQKGSLKRPPNLLIIKVVRAKGLEPSQGCPY